MQSEINATLNFLRELMMDAEKEGKKVTFEFDRGVRQSMSMDNHCQKVQEPDGSFTMTIRAS